MLFGAASNDRMNRAEWYYSYQVIWLKESYKKPMAVYSQDMMVF